MRAVIGTAGHIDHGKSALVRALTGIETDRLPEEQERGISIELGFAYLELPAGDRAGIVDVPGHERFIRQMLAGAHGFDLVLVVVAADDGVMPQTEEHFEIVHLLGVRRAIFVITKIDSVDAARVEEVRGDIEILAVGTPFEGAPTVAVSSIGGEGIEELRALLVRSVEGLEHPQDDRPFRLPIDRVFVMKGHGVVVTGTALAGSVAAGDAVEVLPRRLQARVREVQVHGAVVPRAWAGQRVALNLAGLERDAIVHGETVAGPDLVLGSERFDARVEIRPLARRAVRSHERVRVYLGTSEIRGRLVWLDGIEQVEPRSHAYCQIVLEEPAVVAWGDRFVLRDETAQRTLGGGVVLVARAERHRKARGPVAERLRILEHGDVRARISVSLDEAPSLGLTPQELASATGIGAAALDGALAGADHIVALPDRAHPTLLVSRRRYDRYVEALLAVVDRFHSEHPEQAGVELEHLRTRLVPELDARTFRWLVDDILASGRLARRASAVAAPQHRASVAGRDEGLLAELATRIGRAGVMPPTLKQLEEELGADARRLATLAGVLVQRGEIAKVSSELFFSSTVLESVETALRHHLAREGEISASGFRDLIAASRKYCIPLLDYFDRSGVTVRIGDVRRLRASG